MKNLVKFALLALTLTFAPGAQADDIVDTAVKAGSFKTLVTAVKAADLVDTLKGDGPFTVFAPTDAAFKKVPAKVLNFLLKPENKEVLVKVLTYHAVSGKVLAADVKSGEVATAQGEKVKVKVSKHGVQINKARVVKTDIVCDNGVIHVIDSVLIPPSLVKAVSKIK